MSPTQIDRFINVGSVDTRRLDFTTFSNVINGELCSSDRTNHSVNPSTEDPLVERPIATKQDVEDAVSAARAAFKHWSQTTVAQRKSALNAFADAFEGYTQDFAKLMTEESGKPIRFAVEEVECAIFWIRGMNKLELRDEVIDEPERRATIRYTPLGVVGAIIPWNYPIQLAIVKLAPALITGNTIILKPSPFAPYCTLKIAELAQRFFPPGIVQALHGDDDLGPCLTTHAKINKITFTGSVAIGKKIMEACSQTLKRVTLELGGKDPAIICKDFDIPEVARKVAEFAFANSGQVCVAVKRVYVHESIYSDFLTALVSETQLLQVGDGFQKSTDLGPIQNEEQYNRVSSFFDDVKKHGQKIALGGEIVKVTRGFFIHPTIIDNPPGNARIVVDEPFGEFLQTLGVFVP